MGGNQRTSKKRRTAEGSPRHQRQPDPSVPDLSPDYRRAPLWLRVALPVLVSVAAFCAFLPALDAEFLDWDDDKVITNNIHIRGLTSENIEWMFTENKMGHYHPLTWMSYAIDHAIGEARFDDLPEAEQARYDRGLDPKIFHLTNVLLHADVAFGVYFLAILLLRLVIPPPPDRPDYATPIAAAFATLLFACHPLRVETVAWATERRDVLSSVFLVACLYCYVRHALLDRWGVWKIGFYKLSIILLALSLLGKAWGITLPAIMLVLDVYPLRRIGGRAGWFGRRPVTALVEKTPYLVLAAWFAVQARNAQAAQLDTLKKLDEWGIADRVAQAFYGLFFYSYKTLWPTQLTPLVPLPVNNDPWSARYVVAAVIVLAVVAALIALRRRWPAGIVLAVCYAGILSPVLGVSQSGPQLVADRYSYLACLTWALLGGAGLLWIWRRPAPVTWAKAARPAVGAAALALCVTLAALTWRQTTIWHDSYSLWSHAVKIDPDCVLARSNLGMLERQAGHVELAIEHYQAAMKVDPKNPTVINNLAVALRQDPARMEESIALLREAIALLPKHPDLHYTLATTLDQLGKTQEAIGHLNTSVALKNNEPKYHRGLGEIYLRTKQYALAEVPFRRALELELRLNPRGMGVINALDRLGQIAMFTSRPDQAADYFNRILAIDADNGPALRALARLKAGRP